MIPLLTVAQVRKAEQNAVDAGTSESELMLTAGTRIADLLQETIDVAGRQALVLSGPGKNGGDGVVVADRLLHLGWSVAVWTFKRDGVSGAPVSDDARSNIRWIDDLAGLATTLEQSGIVVDAVFGAGGRAELPDTVRDAFAAVRCEQSRRYLPVWAVDVPSGIDADSGNAADAALPADVTAMIGLPKAGLYQFPAARFTGEIRFIDIGLPAPDDLSPDTPTLLTVAGARATLPERRAGIHKRSAGTLLVIGGAPNYYGAPRLCAEAGLRAGAGLITVAAPSSTIPPMASAVPELTFLPLPVAEHGTAGERLASMVRERLPESNALVVGPGLGTDNPVPDFLSLLFGVRQSARRNIGFGSVLDQEEVEPFRAKAVLDADALNWLAGQAEWWKAFSEAELVLTPHPGELARLLDIERGDVEVDPWGKAREAAKKFGQVVLLKHGHSVVATPEGALYVAPHAPPSLATAGSGDVLSGIVGSLLAQGLRAEDAAKTGVVLGLRATVLAQRDVGETGMIASDLIHRLPAAQASIRRNCDLLS